MQKSLFVFAVLLASVIAQDINVLFNVTASNFGGVSLSADANLAISGAVQELQAKINLTVSEAVRAGIRAGVEASTEITSLFALIENAANVSSLQLIAYRELAIANVTLAQTFLGLYKAQVLVNLTAISLKWTERLANLTAVRAFAVDSTKSLLERARAVLITQVSKLEQFSVAADIIRLRADGELRELSERAALASIVIFNNTIAQKDPILVPGWTVLNNTVLKAKLVDIILAVKIAEWKLNVTIEGLKQFREENAAAIQELNNKVADFTAGVTKTIAEVKAAWKASVNQTRILAERIERFLENVTSVEVSISGLDGSAAITVSVTITRNDLVSDTQAKVEKLLADAVKAVLVTYSSAVEAEISVTVTKTSKRAENTYAVTSSMASASAPPPTDNSSAGFATMSLAACIAFVATLLY